MPKIGFNGENSKLKHRKPKNSERNEDTMFYSIKFVLERKRLKQTWDFDEETESPLKIK